MLPTRDPTQKKRHTQTESEGLDNIFQANGQEKKARQNRLQNKVHKMKRRR